MRTITVKLCEISTRVIPIGFEGENNYTQVVFDASPIFSEYPDATCALSIRPPVGNVYPKAVQRGGHLVFWEVSASDCANDGAGEYQLTFTSGETVCKTFVGNLRIYSSLIGDGTAPDPVTDWLETAQDVLNSLEYISASATSLPAGSEATAEITDVGGHKNIAIGVPAGETGAPGRDGTDGKDGKDGTDGVSPTVTVTAITGGHEVAITDAQGTETFDVMDGEQGEQGEPGTPGADGYSPSASVTKSGHTATITITDKTGTTTAEVSDGDPAYLIDDAEIALNKTYSSSKINSEFSEVKNQVDSKAPVIISTKSGSIVTLTDAVADEPLTDCVVQIEPVQASGTPAPDNILPISGWTGCNVSRTGINLWDEQWEVGNIDNNTGLPAVRNDYIRSKNFCAVSSDQTYYVTYTSESVRVFWYDENKNYITNSLPANKLITAPSNAKYFKIKQFNTTYSNDISINYPSTDTSYHSYSGQTYPITWQTEAGTVYGGTLDVTTGTLTVDRAIVDLGNYNYVYSSQYGYMTTSISGIKQIAATDLPNMLCSALKTIKYNDRATETAPSIMIQASTENIQIRNTGYTDKDLFKTAMSGVQLVYELATPYEIQLTPVEIKTLLSNPNNIWSDTGDVAVSYKADTKAYVDQNEGVKDVKVNGTSVVTDGVANIPLADTTNPGTVVVGAGLQIYNNKLLTNPASSAYIKAGAAQNLPIVPYSQHESVFYGLAKLAGVDMASSSNPVGTFTDAAKTAIQKMLGIYVPPFELIREITLTERTSLNITVDDNGLPFELLDVFVEIYYDGNLESESSGYGRWYFYDSDGNYTAAETGRYTTNANSQFKNIYIQRKNNMTFCEFTRLAGTGNYGAWVSKCMNNGGTKFNMKNIVRIAMNSNDYEPIGAKIKIYGQRAY